MSKRLWMEAARADFLPGPREPCAVCGKYRSLSQAHHLTPLSVQFANGLLSGNFEPDHRHIWLCPTHHIALHILIDQAGSERLAASRATIDIAADVGTDELRALMDLIPMCGFPSKKTEAA